MIPSYRLYAGETICSRHRHSTQKLNFLMSLLFWSLGAFILLLSTAPLEASQVKDNASPAQLAPCVFSSVDAQSISDLTAQ